MSNATKFDLRMLKRAARVLKNQLVPIPVPMPTNAVAEIIAQIPSHMPPGALAVKSTPPAAPRKKKGKTP